MARWVVYFSDPLPEGWPDPKSALGGKGASLKEMSRAGLAVPPGFTIGTEACRRYFEDGRRWPDGLEDEVRANLARLERETGRAFGRGAHPLLVSVRSGAAVSMPGMMDTILNCGLTPALAGEVGDDPAFWRTYLNFLRAFAGVVHGLGPADLAATVDEDGQEEADAGEAGRILASYEAAAGRPFPATPWDELVECINAVFESWQNDRAVAYRQKHDIRGLAGTAVNVQMMFPSEVSGVVFTRDPGAPQSDRMVIEASFGLGEAVVSGEVTPDRFYVDRTTGAVESHLGHKVAMLPALGRTRVADPGAPSLTPAQLGELAALALRIEAHFGHPVDIEFGWADGGFALLQSRRIRGLEVTLEVETARLDEIRRLRELSGTRRACWVIHNLSETLRAPTPLTWDVIRDFMKGDGGFGRMYQALGYRPSDRIRRDGFLDLIAGRIYADPERQAGMFWDALPLVYDLDALVADRTQMDRAPTRFDPERADGRFLARLPATLWNMARISRRMRDARRTAREHFEHRVLPPYREYVKRERERKLSSLADRDLVAELHARRRAVLDDFGPESLKPGFFGGLAYDGLVATLSLLLGKDEGEALAMRLTRALDGDTTVEQDELLWDVAGGRAELAAFLERFGHRAVGEMELAVPRWREEPSYIEQTVDRLRRLGGHGPHEVHERSRVARAEAEQSLDGILKQAGGSVLMERVRHDLADAQSLLPYRESGKHYLMMGYDLVRRPLHELSERWGLGQRLFFLRLDELDRFLSDRERLTDEIEKRRIRHQAFQRLEMPDVVDSRDLDRLGLPAPLQAATDMKGVGLAGGVATGPARIVYDPQQAGDLGLDYILVCPTTDPGWTPLFMQARGLVVERGGVLSHGAIVARDFGIPAVALPGATRLIADGDRVRLDGGFGRVEVLERAAGGGGPREGEGAPASVSN